MTADLRTMPWLRSTAFVAINALVVLLVVTLVVLPSTRFFEDRDKAISEKNALLVRMTAIAERDSDVRSGLQAVETNEGRGEYLQGANDNAIVADLQTKLKAISEAAGARLRSVQGIPSRTIGRLKYSGVRIDIQGSLLAIHRTIHTVESASPYLFVVEAVIKPALPIGGRPDLAQEPVIQAQLDIFGAVRSGARVP